MKLALQIAAGIFLAGLASWVFWIAIVASAASQLPKVPLPNRVFDVSKAWPQYPIRPAVAPAVAAASVALPAPECKNFVQMQGGLKHCLSAKAR